MLCLLEAMTDSVVCKINGLTRNNSSGNTACRNKSCFCCELIGSDLLCHCGNK
jgi:hypothetical protein